AAGIGRPELTGVAGDRKAKWSASRPPFCQCLQETGPIRSSLLVPFAAGCRRNQNSLRPDQAGPSMTRHRSFQRLGFFWAALLGAWLAVPTLQAAQAAAPAALDELARDTERAEAIRAVRKLQHAYSHYAQYGLWNDLGALFARDGEWIWGDQSLRGPAAIAAHQMETVGGGKAGLPDGVMNSLFVDVPLINLSVDGRRAQARWYGLHMLGGGDDARWESGTFQND